MEGFDEAVNGYYDVGDQLRRYLVDRAAEGFSVEREEKRSLDSRAAFEARRERVREAFLSGIGGLPERPTHQSIETRGALERDGYSVEQIGRAHV